MSDAWGLGEETVAYAAARGDLDGDGDNDLVVVVGEEQVAIYQNTLPGGEQVLVELRGRSSNRFGIGARIELESGGITQLRQMLAARGYMGSNEPVEHFGVGKEKKIKRLRVTWPSGIVQEFADLDAGFRYRVTEPPVEGKRPPRLVQAESRGALFSRVPLSLGRHRETVFDDFKKQPLLPNQLSQLGGGIAWGDVDADGDDDLFIGGAAGQAGELRLNDGKGGFEEQWVGVLQEDKECEDMGAVFFDSDSDGDLDLFVASGSYEFEPASEALRDRLYLNDGKGGFERAPADAVPAARRSSGPVAAADFDRDGDVDLFVGGRVIPGRYPLSPRSALFKNTGGKFTDASSEVPGLAEPGMVTGALWSDATGDGWLDLLVTVEWGPVKLFVNQNGRLREGTTEAALAERSGWWNSLAGGDVDHDGDIDYVVTNVGLNTKYHASADHPVKLFYGDFEKDGNLQLVEAEYEGGILFPVRGKSCSTRAMPHLAGKFSTFRDFAKASLAEIYTPGGLDASHQFSANTLESGLLVNDGNGKFAFRPLPWMAQLAPCFGAAITDLDGDGHPDIALAQNFFGPQVETGRFDGGLSVMLRGDGKGDFSEVWPKESGIVVTGDSKSLTVSDFNNDLWPDLLIGQNDDAPVALARTSERGGNRMLKVRLAGGTGNPTAVGARVALTSSDGRSVVHEIAAGSGYLSHSPPVVFAGLGSTARVTEISVRWPDGKSTKHTGPWDGTSPVLIKHP